MGRKRFPMIGKVFGEFTVIEFSHSDPVSCGCYWICSCSCGNTRTVLGSSLRNGSSTRCNRCRDKLNVTHGMHNTSIYRTWAQILSRCTNPKVKKYKDYGARGIGIDDPRWFKFEAFYSDMGDRPKGLQIDRIDNNKGYSKANCRWVTRKENMNNRRPYSEWDNPTTRKPRPSGLTYNTKKRREAAALLVNLNPIGE